MAEPSRACLQPSQEQVGHPSPGPSCPSDVLWCAVVRDPSRVCLVLKPHVGGTQVSRWVSSQRPSRQSPWSLPVFPEASGILVALSLGRPRGADLGGLSWVTQSHGVGKSIPERGLPCVGVQAGRLEECAGPSACTMRAPEPVPVQSPGMCGLPWGGLCVLGFSLARARARCGLEQPGCGAQWSVWPLACSAAVHGAPAARGQVRGSVLQGPTGALFSQPTQTCQQVFN